MGAIDPDNSQEEVVEGSLQGSLQCQQEEGEAVEESVMGHQALFERETLIDCMSGVVCDYGRVFCFYSCLYLSCGCPGYGWRCASGIDGVSERASSFEMRLGNEMSFLSDFFHSCFLRGASSFRKTGGTTHSM